jgi:hypothetical protein
VRDSSTFTKYCTCRFSDNFAPAESGDLRHVDQQWPDHDVGNFTLGRMWRKIQIWGWARFNCCNTFRSPKNFLSVEHARPRVDLIPDCFFTAIPAARSDSRASSV